MSFSLVNCNSYEFLGKKSFSVNAFSINVVYRETQEKIIKDQCIIYAPHIQKKCNCIQSINKKLYTHAIGCHKINLISLLWFLRLPTHNIYEWISSSTII